MWMPAVADQLIAAADLAVRCEDLESGVARLSRQRDNMEAECRAAWDACERLRVDRKPDAAPAVQTYHIGPADTAFIVESLERWASREFDAPHADIARIRALFSSPGGGS
jgi:hypothetical protein